MNHKCLYCYKQFLKDERDFHARCSKKFFDSDSPPALDYTLEEMSKLAKEVVEHSVSVPGVQPKLSLSFINDILEDKAQGRLTIVGTLGGNYILKPPSHQYPGMPENEHLTMKIAEAFGIPVVPSSLIRLRSGELSYITKRIDRTKNGEKIHMIDMFQILETSDKYKGSMERIAKAVFAYTQNTLLDTYRLFELVVFCFLTGNNDMHLKNFSMIYKEDVWQLSPAYDLLNVHLHLPEDTEELALTLNAKKRKLKQSDFTRFGQVSGLNDKQINSVYSRFQKAIPQWETIIQSSFLPDKMQKDYIKLIKEKSKRIL